MNAWRKWICLLLATGTLVAVAGPVRVIVRTEHLNEDPASNPPDRPRRVDALPLEFEDFEIGKLAQTLRRAQEVLPAEAPSVIPFYFVEGRSESEQRATIAETLRQLHEVYPDARPKIEVRYLPSPLPAIQRELSDTIEAAAAEAPEDRELRDGLFALRDAKDDAWRRAAEAVPLRSTAGQRLSKPSTVRWLRGINAVMHGVLIAIPRAVQVATGPGGALHVAAGVALAVFDTTYQVAINYFTWQFGKALRDHGIPGSTRSKVIAALNRIYTSRTAAKIKGAFYGLGFGVLVTAFQQSLRHLANPAVPWPGAAALTNVGAKGIVGAIDGAWGGQHLEFLRQKGWISQPVIDLFIRAVSYLFIPAILLDTSGRPELYVYSWILYLTPMAILSSAIPLNWLLPPRRDRMVVMDAELAKGAARADLDQIEATEATTRVAVEEGEVEKKVEEVKRYTRLRERRRPRCPFARLWR